MRFIMISGAYFDGPKLRKKDDVFNSELPLNELFPDTIAKYGGAVEEDELQEEQAPAEEAPVEEKRSEDRIIGNYRLVKGGFGRFHVFNNKTDEKITKKAYGEKRCLELISRLEEEAQEN